MNVTEAIELIKTQVATSPHIVRLPCRVRHVRDADTIVVTISGAYEWAIRLKDINAPERGTPRGRKATDFCKDVLLAADTIEVVVDASGLAGDKPENPLHAIGTFDRIVGDILCDGQSLSDTLVNARHAVKIAG